MPLDSNSYEYVSFPQLRANYELAGRLRERVITKSFIMKGFADFNVKYFGSSSGQNPENPPSISKFRTSPRR
ncbi:hypothetical protein BPOR_0766g00030 [Botrytis porri]|uniref:Uncharacterized protein n=1 Tax=Botrytis porri TaxID=87229 RepID=A0A4Z1K9H4_9HELO|nr:hypothetical protein BPOR_0766g00030 [Botrytis porri]